MIRIKIVSFTTEGARTGARIAKLLDDELTEQYARSEDLSLRSTELTRFAQQAMVDCDLIIFVGNTDGAVRAIAPYIQNNGYDPAVFVVDEESTFVIPLLRGRTDSVNACAQRVAAGLQVFLADSKKSEGKDEAYDVI